MSYGLVPYKFKLDAIIQSGRTTIYNIDGIKEWLKQMPIIPPMSEEQIAVFLLACNNDIEATKSCILAYFKYRAGGPELFSSRNMDSDQLIIANKVAKVAVLPHRTKENYVIVAGELRETSYSNFYLDGQTKYLYMLLDCLLYENPPSGVIVVINLKGVGLMHLTRFKLIIVRKFFQYLQEALPTKLKQIHVLNTSYIFDKAMMILKPFMSKDLYEMISTHTPNMNINTFHEKYIPANLLPSDYGGTLPSMEVLSSETKTFCRDLKCYLDSTEQQVEIYKENRI